MMTSLWRAPMASSAGASSASKSARPALALAVALGVESAAAKRSAIGANTERAGSSM